jgi:MFS family permease
MFFLGTLYLQEILGYDPLEIGFAFLPGTLVMGILSARYSERLVMRYGARRTLIPGLIMIMASLVLFTRAPVDGNWLEHILPVMILLGAGAGTAFPALMKLAMSDVSPSEAGLASGLVNTTAQVGAALGLAVLATVSASRTEGLIEDGEPVASALTSGYHLSFWIGAALVLAAIAVALTVLAPDEQGEHASEEAPAPQPEPAYSEAA